MAFFCDNHTDLLEPATTDDADTDAEVDFEDEASDSEEGSTQNASDAETESYVGASSPSDSASGADSDTSTIIAALPRLRDSQPQAVTKKAKTPVCWKLLDLK